MVAGSTNGAVVGTDRHTLTHHVDFDINVNWLDKSDVDFFFFFCFVACLQFEMLTGTLPFQGKDRNETMNMILKWVIVLCMTKKVNAWQKWDKSIIPFRDPLPKNKKKDSVILMCMCTNISLRFSVSESLLSFMIAPVSCLSAASCFSVCECSCVYHSAIKQIVPSYNTPVTNGSMALQTAKTHHDAQRKVGFYFLGSQCWIQTDTNPRSTRNI